MHQQPISDRRWYAVYTKSRQEKRALEHLNRQQYDCFLPMTKVRRKRGGKRCWSIEALFPRYLFLHVDPTAENVAPVRSTQGVTGIVRFGGRLTEVPRSFIESLIAAVDDHSGAVELPTPRLELGDNVTILEGPFEGLHGVLLARNGEERVRLLITLMGKEARITLPTAVVR